MPARARERPIVKGGNLSPILLLLAGVVAVALHLYSPTNWSPLSLKILHSLHGPGFAALTVLVFFSLKRQSYPRNYLAAAVVLTGIVVISEVAQLFVGRQAQFGDVVTDAVAVLGTLGVIAIVDRHFLTSPVARLKWLLGPLAAIALVGSCTPTIWLGYVHVQKSRAFPTLLSNEYGWEQESISPVDGHYPTRRTNPANWPTAGAFVLEAAPEGPYGIFVSIHPVSDWSGYDRLTYVISTTAGIHDVMVCVREQRRPNASERNRLCHIEHVTSTPSKLSFSLTARSGGTVGERLDLSRIEAVVFSAMEPGEVFRVWVDEIVLERPGEMAP